MRVVATAIGVGRWRAPVLTTLGQFVRGRADRHRRHVLVAMAPHVVAVRVDPDGEVQLERLAPLGHVRGQCPHLLVDDPLGDHVVAHQRGVDVVPAQQAAARRRGPTPPVEPELLTRGPKPGVVVHVGAREHEGLHGVLHLGHIVTARRHPGLDDAALGLEGRRAVHLAVDDPPGSTFGREGLGHEALGDRRAREVGDPVEGDPTVAPERPAHRTVGARLEGVGPEGREQRQGRHDARVVSRDQSGELVQVADVASPPGALRVEREHRRLDREGPPVPREAAPGPVQRANDDRRPERPAPEHQVQVVVADPQRRQRESYDGPVNVLHRGPRRERVDADAPGDLPAELELQSTVQLARTPPHPDGNGVLDPLVDDVDRFHHRVGALRAPVAQSCAGVGGRADLLHVPEGVQHGHEDLGIGPSLHPRAVEVLKRHAALARQVAQRRRELGSALLAHWDHVISPGIASPAVWRGEGPIRATTSSRSPSTGVKVTP